MKNLILIVLLGSAGMAAHQAVAPPAEGPSETTVSVADVVPLEPLQAGVRHKVGSAGSRLTGSSIVGMTVRTEEMLQELEPSIGKTWGLRRQRAEDVSERIRALNTGVRTSLEEGRPIEAFRAAMEARALIDAVRHQVAEEAMR